MPAAWRCSPRLSWYGQGAQRRTRINGNYLPNSTSFVYTLGITTGDPRLRSAGHTQYESAAGHVPASHDLLPHWRPAPVHFAGQRRPLRQGAHQQDSAQHPGQRGRRDSTRSVRTGRRHGMANTANYLLSSSPPRNARRLPMCVRRLKSLSRTVSCPPARRSQSLRAKRFATARSSSPTAGASLPCYFASVVQRANCSRLLRSTERLALARPS